jgi:hypothetical protein
VCGRLAAFSNVSELEISPNGQEPGFVEMEGRDYVRARQRILLGWRAKGTTLLIAHQNTNNKDSFPLFENNGTIAIFIQGN